MPAATMSETQPRKDRSVRDIIASARAVRKQEVTRVGVRGALGMSFASAVLMWLCFTPVNASPLAWIAPVPLIMLARIQERARWMYSAVYLGSLISQLATLQWMRLGDPTMYIAWAALSIYLAGYAVAFVAVTRIAMHRWGTPLVIAAPVAWTGLEYFRANMLTGFAWYFLGHSQYRWLELIQISDLVGAYGVSFLIVMSASALAIMVPHRWMIWFGLESPSTGPTTATGLTGSQLIQVSATLVLFVAVLAYGYVRRSQADFKPGPRVALIQGNFVASLHEDQPAAEDVFYAHLRLNQKAVREHPQIIVWPESMYPWPLLSADPTLTDEQLRNMVPMVKPESWRDKAAQSILEEESRRAGAALIFGANTANVSLSGFQHQNSAVFVTPSSGLTGRYDKMHLVPFGEYIPLRDAIPIMRLFSPYRDAGGLTAGTSPAVFEYGPWRLAPIICFEDTVPDLVRKIVAAGSNSDQGAPIDVLVNLTNDGWFHGSSELDQHLITAAFRAVECRTPLIRAVNTGISAIVDGDGAIRDPEVFIDGDARRNSPQAARTTARDPKTGAWYKQLNAALIHTVPLDSRRSFYVRFGDWFAQLCAAAAVMVAISTFIPAARKSAAHCS